MIKIKTNKGIDIEKFTNAVIRFFNELEKK